MSRLSTQSLVVLLVLFIPVESGKEDASNELLSSTSSSPQQYFETTLATKLTLEPSINTIRSNSATNQLFSLRMYKESSYEDFPGDNPPYTASSRLLPLEFPVDSGMKEKRRVHGEQDVSESTKGNPVKQDVSSGQWRHQTPEYLFPRPTTESIPMEHILNDVRTTPLPRSVATKLAVIDPQDDTTTSNVEIISLDENSPSSQ